MMDAAGNAAFACFRLRPPARSSFRNALIVRLDHLGDILTVTGAPQALKENYPGCRVTFLTSTAGAALLQNNPFVDEVIVYDTPWFFRGARPQKGERRVLDGDGAGPRKKV